MRALFVPCILIAVATHPAHAADTPSEIERLARELAPSSGGAPRESVGESVAAVGPVTPEPSTPPQLAPAAAEPDQGGYNVATVADGDTVSKLIIREYGRYSTKLLAFVVSANPHIGDPSNVEVGTELRLPRDIQLSAISLTRPAEADRQGSAADAVSEAGPATASTEPAAEPDGREESSDASANVSEPVDAAEEATAPVEPNEPSNGVVDVAEPIDAAEQATAPVEPGETADAVVDATEPIDAAEEATAPVEPGDTADAVVDATEPIDAAEEVAAPVEPSEGSDVVVDAAEPVEARDAATDASAQRDGIAEPTKLAMSTAPTTLSRVQEAVAVAEPDYALVTVGDGDYIAKLIKRQYGTYSPELLARVMDANPHIDEPDRVEVGSELRLPLSVATPLPERAPSPPADVAQPDPGRDAEVSDAPIETASLQVEDVGDASADMAMPSLQVLTQLMAETEDDAEEAEAATEDAETATEHAETATEEADAASSEDALAEAIPAKPLPGAHRYNRTGTGVPQLVRLSLADALEISLRGNLALSVARLSRHAAETTIPQAQAEFHPTLGIAGIVTEDTQADNGVRETVERSKNVSAFISEKLPTGGTMTVSSSIVREDEGPTEFDGALTVSIVQPLLRGGGFVVARRGIADAKYDTQVAEASLRSEVLRVMFDTKDAYYAAANLAGNIAATKEAIERDEQLVEASGSLFSRRLVTKRDVYSAEIQLADDQTRLAEFTEAYQNAKNALLDVLGLPISHRLELADVDMTFHPIPLKLDTWVSAAIRNRPEILALETQIEQSGLNLSVARNTVFPQLDLIASYGKQETGTTADRAFNLEGDTWTAGLTFSFPLGNVAAQKALTQAQIEHARLRDRLADAQRLAELRVRTSVLRLTRSEEEARLLERKRVNSEGKLEVAKSRFALGVATNFDIIDSQKDLLDAEIDLLQAVRDYNVAIADLERNVGGPI